MGELSTDFSLGFPPLSFSAVDEDGVFGFSVDFGALSFSFGSGSLSLRPADAAATPAVLDTGDTGSESDSDSACWSKVLKQFLHSDLRQA